MARRILVTGGAGQVGLELQAADWPLDIEILAPTRDELQISDRASVEPWFAANPVDVIVNCAAHTAVDKAEEEVGEAFAANAMGPAHLADMARTADIPLVQISTDYVFDGCADAAYGHDDVANPSGVYGASKRAGELAALSGNPRTIVLRVAWVLSAHRSNFLKTMLRVGATHPKLRVVADQQGCPTSAKDIAEAIRILVLRLMDDGTAPTGIYHFVNAGSASWHELAQHIFAEASALGGPSPEVEAIGTADYPTPARRPANSRLDTSRISADYGITPREWRLAVRDIVHQLNELNPFEGS